MPLDQLKPFMKRLPNLVQCRAFCRRAVHDACRSMNLLTGRTTDRAKKYIYTENNDEFMRKMWTYSRHLLKLQLKLFKLLLLHTVLH